jgi:hypothetical protein
MSPLLFALVGLPALAVAAPEIVSDGTKVQLMAPQGDIEVRASPRLHCPLHALVSFRHEVDVDEGKVACVVSTSVTLPSPLLRARPLASSHSVLVGLAVCDLVGCEWVGGVGREGVALRGGLRARLPCVHQKDNSIVIPAAKPRTSRSRGGQGE